ncbi:hypothetical protein [Microbacterium enclense]|uniref:hypothetical protein n=1 Tax=Microbacterium enclense TaxID=993073 RepID=UPI003F7FA668
MTSLQSKPLEPSPPVGTIYASTSDFWRMVRLSAVGTHRSLSRWWPAQVFFACVFVLIGTHAGVEAALAPSLVPLVAVPLAWAGLLTVMISVLLLVLTYIRLASDRMVILSADRTAVLDVIIKQDHVTIANHTKLNGTSSAAGLRASVGLWLPEATALPLRFWAQREPVAKLYIRQFPSLQRTGRKKLTGSVELEAHLPSA